MKKTIALFIFLITSLVMFGQNDTSRVVINDPADVHITDTGITITKKTDTVYVPVYLIESTDTILATVIYKKNLKSDRVYTMQGLVLMRGFKTAINGKAVWLDNPSLAGVLDKKKRPIKNIIQILR